MTSADNGDNKEQEYWEKYIKTLPDKVRVGLAEYAAQQFLDGVKAGEIKKTKEIIGKLIEVTTTIPKYDHKGWTYFIDEFIKQYGVDATKERLAAQKKKE
jgi:hypothetical protein